MITPLKVILFLTLCWIVLASTNVAAQEYSPPSTGNIVGITILVDFDDVVGTVSSTDIDTYLNSTTTSMWGNNGSVRNYFEDVSNGMLIYTNWVTAGYYRAQNLIASYNAPTLAHECLQHLEDTGFDFSQYDSNEDGYVDAVSIRFAGNSGQNTNLSANCWPTTFATNDGVTVNRFAIVAIDGGLGLNPFCHETGHMICGFPDLYGSQGSHVGSYCLMGYASGLDSRNPTQPCAPLKIMAGWMTVTDLVTPQADIPVTIETNECYRFAHPLDPNESFVIYNRQQVNRDANLSDAGLTIWHAHWEQDEHPKVAMEANGNVFKAGGSYEEFSMFTEPSSDWWDGTPSGLYIHDVSPADPNMTFSFGDVGDLQVSNPAGFFTNTSEGTYPEQTVFIFTLTNTGSGPLDWTAVTWASWMDLSHTEGTLESGGMDVVTASLNAQVLNLVGGVWDADIEFADTTNGTNGVRRVRINVTTLERLGHWKFDESTGATIAQDSSGLGHDADLKGGPEYTNGTFGNALRIASSAQYAEISGLDQISDRVTITGWIKRNGDQSDAAGIFFNRYGLNWNYGSGLNFGTDNELGYAWAGDLETWNFDSNLFVPDGQWVFAALAVKPNEATLYLHNGTEMQSATNSVPHGQASFTSKTYIGKDPYWAGGRNFVGDIDDFQVFNFVLTEQQLECVRLGGMPTLPSPYNRQEIRATEQVLTWEAGPTAETNNVYFGTSLAAVLNADPNAAEFKGNQTDTFYDPGMLQLNTPYFWRIEPVIGGTAYPSLLWSFQLVTLRVPRDFAMIQEAIDAAVPGEDQIEVAPGIYYEAIDFKGKAVRLYSAKGPEATIINGNGAFHVVQCVSGEDPNTILEGFTIADGNAISAFPDNQGGGMYNNGSSPTVTNCIFSGSMAAEYGGGMHNSSSSPFVTDCIFTSNMTTRGGGMSNSSSSPTVSNSVFSNNLALGGYGGGMYNSANSTTTVTNCTFYGNWGGYGGGGMRNEDSSSILTNCTFNDNGAAYWGQGISNNSSNPTVSNCILWGDSGGGGEIYGTATVTYSNVQDGTGETWFGQGCIDSDPLFVNAAVGDLHLLSASPCIDRGNNSYVPTEITTDLDGYPRIIDGDCNSIEVVDMGAYEFSYVYLGDFDFDCGVDLIDFAILANYWLDNEILLDIYPAPAGDGIINAEDLAIFCENWLFGK